MSFIPIGFSTAENTTLPFLATILTYALQPLHLRVMFMSLIGSSEKNRILLQDEYPTLGLDLSLLQRILSIKKTHIKSRVSDDLVGVSNVITIY